MKKTIRLSMMTCLIALAAPALAGTTCFGSKKEYDALSKASLPPLLRKLPLLMTKDDMAATVALEIKSSGDKLMMTGHVWAALSAPYKDQATIKKVCVTGNKVEITMTNGESKDVVVIGNTAKVEGTILTQNPGGFPRVLAKIQNKMQPTFAATGSGPSHAGMQ